ncbi:MAG: RMD1 family protein [Rickettsiaceae bacterium]|nr:RMD1 family protein [Rickettsiaceae bacterium]
MKCVSSYCIAKTIDLKKLAKQIPAKEVRFYDQELHVRLEVASGIMSDIFCFSFGSIIIWGANQDEEKSLLNECAKFTDEKLADNAFDLIYYRIDESSEKTYIDEEANVIVLHKDTVFLKLSISHALAQSVKLNVLEDSVSNLLKTTAPIQQELAKKGTVSLTKREISQNIGMLFNERYSINLHSDILDTPEFFWRKPKYEPLYLMTAEFMEIVLRQNILNKRLDNIHELYLILSNELNYKHSTRLEIIIIILIACEVLIGLTNHAILTVFF